ncbi:Alpha-1,2-mannosidase [Acidisarcina polymorpha]|uniref:Alpha-1,2-mannosidase n=1 Tax=Acidisarcina polymorpha TaxID=2211140 RepID=A0A2Z5G4Y3_9BACT|nr:GH92 family glycosyl hydrolase [Acidisarcina polymorpha]AXC13894.1 Alpha-1,2-mannosidase [Acidisarcina polymorpha]
MDSVDPHIGGIGHLLTSNSPEAQLPHGMMVVTPWFARDVTDVYLATRMYGFTVGASVIMPVSGKITAAPDRIFSEWDPDNDVVTPYSSRYLLEDFETVVEYAVSERGAHFRFHFPDGKPANIFLRPQETAQYKLSGSKTILGTEQKQGVNTYLCVEFSRSPVSQRKVTVPAGGAVLGDTDALVLDFGQGVGVVEVRAAISYISRSQGAQTLREQLAAKSFDETRSAGRAAWEKALEAIHVEGGSDEQRAIFYTALYRFFQYPKDVTEDGHYFGPYDRKIRDASGNDFYIEDNLWDTYRTRHPLSALIEPRRHQDMLRSYVRLFEESGWMPQFPFMAGDLPFMDGNNAASMFLDAYGKGQRDFDLELAYQGIRKDAMQATMLPYRRGALTDLDQFYQKHGYFPALRKGEKETEPRVDPDMRRQAVSVTLDSAYDDWCVAEVAKILGKADDTEYFGRRALNYRNLYNPATGFMSPKGANGEFIPDFDSKWSGGQAGRDYFTECNGWVYSFDVPHDIGGLIALMGGRDRFVGRLDQLFAEGYNGRLKFEFLAQFPDSTALIGQYPQGNEPAHHIAYLYNYAGAPWKTQKRVRQIMRNWYASRPLGLPGDDDNGAMSSWYVFSAMGFYPICPGRPIYTIGSPLFNKSLIQVSDGKIFTIVANRTSVVNKYIQSARLNGSDFNRTWFEHADVVNGGTLVLEMGPEPNKSWAAGLDAAPPSLSPQLNS